MDYLSRSIDYTQPHVAAVLDEMSYWASKFAGMIFDYLELRPNIRVLDVACGTGVPLFELAHMHGESCDFTGIDVWDAGLERAAHKLSVYGLSNVRLLKIEDGAFGLPDASFDLIVCSLGINNFANPERVLAECARVAKPGARVVFTTNIKGHMQEFYEAYREVLRGFGKPEYLTRLETSEDRRGTRETLTALIEGAGFGITRIIEDSFTLRYLNGSAMLRHFFVILGFLDGWRDVVDKDDEADVFAKLEARLNELALRQGDLRMTIPMLYLEAVK